MFQESKMNLATLKWLRTFYQCQVSEEICIYIDGKCQCKVRQKIDLCDNQGYINSVEASSPISSYDLNVTFHRRWSSLHKTTNFHLWISISNCDDWINVKELRVAQIYQNCTLSLLSEKSKYFHFWTLFSPVSQMFANESAFSLIYCPMSNVFSRCFQLFTHNSTIIVISICDPPSAMLLSPKTHFKTNSTFSQFRRNPSKFLRLHTAVTSLSSSSLFIITIVTMQFCKSENGNLDEAMKCRGVDYKHIRRFEEDCHLSLFYWRFWKVRWIVEAFRYCIWVKQR